MLKILQVEINKSKFVLVGEDLLNFMIPICRRFKFKIKNKR